MATIKEQLLKDAADLYNQGLEILKKEAALKQAGKKDDSFLIQIEYQSWYSKACPVIQQVLPERFKEFIELYQIEKRKEIDYVTYTIKDYLLGLSVTRGIYKEEVVNPFSAFVSKYQQQLFIFNSVLDCLKSRLSDIESVLQSNLFESELEAAEELLKKKHLRAAGVLAGVTLEAHLSKTFSNHGLKTRKKTPTISDFNDALKKENIIDIPSWRLIQRLGDIRNLCAHPKDREPKSDEVQDLIIGTKKVIAEIF